MAVPVVAALHDEIIKAKESLKGVDENIKKLTGRVPGEIRPGVRRLSGGGQGDIRGGRERIFNAARRSLGQDGPTPAKRRAVGGAFSRLGPRVGRPGRGPDSGDEDDLPHKPAVQSSIIATPKESRSRKDSMEEASKDEKGKARNRRMFGLLLGTLQKFKEESKVKGEQEEQRRAIEQKLEQKAVQEKEEIKKERQTLFNERRAKQAKLRHLEQKMELVEIHETWEELNKPLFSFIRTASKPYIFFMPKSHTPASEEKHKESVKALEETVLKRRQELESDIEAIMMREEAAEKNEDKDMEVADPSSESREVHESKKKVGDDKENRDRKHSDKASPKKEHHREKEHKHHRSDEGRRDGEGRSRRDSGREGSRERRRESGREAEGSRERKRESGKEEGSRERRHSDHRSQSDKSRRRSSGGSRDHRESGKSSRRDSQRQSEKERDEGDESEKLNSSKDSDKKEIDGVEELTREDAGAGDQGFADRSREGEDTADDKVSENPISQVSETSIKQDFSSTEETTVS